MTGEELWGLKEGDLVRLTEEVSVGGSQYRTWTPKDILRVEYREHGCGVDIIYLKNITKEVHLEKPFVERFEPVVLLNYGQKILSKGEVLHKTEFKHQFDIGDTIWHMVDNKPSKETINSIEFVKRKNGTIEIRYGVERSSGYFVEGKSNFYGTIDELLDSLRK